MKLGLQLFTLIDIMNTQDGLRKVIKHAADAGYDGVEFAGFHSLSLEEIKEELDKYGLECAGIHLGWDYMNFENLDKNPQKVLDAAKAIGAQSATIASFNGKTKEEWLDFARRIDSYGKLFRENGIALGYHNHRHEFMKFDGEYIIDILLSNCDPENIFWELDPRHIVVARENPVEFAKKYSGRSPYMHVRDLSELVGDDASIECAVGDGIVDIKSTVEASGHHEWLIVEEGPIKDGDMVDVVRRSAKYMRNNFVF